jgi:hypothetical protein
MDLHDDRIVGIVHRTMRPPGFDAAAALHTRTGLDRSIDRSEGQKPVGVGSTDAVLYRSFLPSFLPSQGRSNLAWYDDHRLPAAVASSSGPVPSHAATLDCGSCLAERN